jgi:hypothetical protein
MIYNINLNIKVELNGLSEEQLLDIQNIIMKSMYNDKRIDFEELDKIFALSARPYYSTSLQHVKLSRNLMPKTVEIEICG